MTGSCSGMQSSAHLACAICVGLCVFLVVCVCFKSSTSFGTFPFMLLFVDCFLLACSQVHILLVPFVLLFVCFFGCVCVF